MPEQPPVYLILGARGAQRRAIVADLIAGYFDEGEPVEVALPAGEDDASDGIAALRKRATTGVVFVEAIEDLPAPQLPLFILPPGDASPADGVEAFANWLRRHRIAPTRLLTVIHCRLQVEDPEVMTPWHRACVHFSDAVLLSRREGLAPTALQEFLAYFEKERYPCPIELVKKGRVPNPALVLEPEPRRMSLMFDADLEAVDFLEIDEDNLPEEPIDLKRPTDPYLERDQAGQRLKPLPDISRLLDPEERD